MSASGRTPATCPVCGAAIHPKDRFCGACGADVVASGAGSGSLFDELMSDDDPYTAPTPAQGYRVPDDEGHDDGRYGHGEPVQDGPHEPTEAYASGGSHPDVPPAPRDEGPSRGSVLLPLVILVVVVLAAILAWQLAPRGGGGSGTAAGTSSSQDASGGQPSESGGEGSTPSESSGPEKVEMASSAKRCDDVGGAVAYRGNSVTSCDFAVEVAKALQDDDPDLPAKVTARSPVTKKKYTMQCENTAPVTCRGGNEALVYVDRG